VCPCLTMMFDEILKKRDPLCVQYLETICNCLSSLGKRAMLYLAAAVSDFYIPWDEMVG